MKNKHRIMSLILSMLFVAAFTLTAAAEYTCTSPGKGGSQGPVKGTWSQDEQGARFTAEDGQVYASHWLYYKNAEYKGRLGVWCYFDENGYMLRDRFLDFEGEKYYLGEDGVLKTGWFVKGGHLYNGGLHGALYTSANYPPGKHFVKGNKKYRFDAEGRAISQDGEYDSETLKEISEEAQRTSGTGWKEIDNKWTYWRDGQQVISDWVETDGNWYYFDKTGTMVRERVVEIDGFLYCFLSDGAMRTSGRTDYQGEKYDIQPDGRLAGWGLDAVMKEQHVRMNRNHNPYVDNPTVQWINATYAILTHSNGANIKMFGGTAYVDESTKAYGQNYLKQELASSWGVTDRASADRVLDNLIASGNATGSAWDYSRAVSNLGNYYLAGYYTETEALDKALEVARIIQIRFDSWDSYNQSYLAGYNAWRSENSRERESVLAELKASRHNPFAIDWNLNLERSWGN